MSLSDPRRIVARGLSAAADPADALREALNSLCADLARQGAAPGDILRIDLHARRPEAFSLSRRVIDLAWREILGGLRRPILCHQGDLILMLEAQADVQPARETPVIWRGMNMPELARAYSPRLQADMRAVFAKWNEEGAAFRADQAGLDLRYGPTRDEVLDFYPAQRRNAPLWVFMHGGYWQACTKDQHGQFAEGMLRNGFAVANLDYGLAPEASLAEIVVQVRHALQFLIKHAAALGFDPAQIHLAGHSAGAHLAAMGAIDPHGPAIASALLLSGVFDLEPLFHLPMGQVIGLDSRNWRVLSPAFSPPRKVKIGLAVGALETDEFKRQSADMASQWAAPTPLYPENCNHFSLLEGLREPGPLLDLAVRTASAQP
jgi:arylformamidase